MKLLLALVACLVAVAIAWPGMGSSSSMNGGQDNQVYRDPSTGRSYTQDQVRQALEAMFGYNNNQMMFDSRQQPMFQPYQQYNTNANRG